MSTATRALFEFDDSYARELPSLSVPWRVSPVPAPSLLVLNGELADELGVDADLLREPVGVALLAGNTAPDGVSPAAQAYSEHQFGGYVPRLGDGRALLLGEVLDRRGRRRDLHLKGSGRTPFARGGDGRAAVGPMLREYLMGEAMHALGIPTTRALAVAASGEAVARDTIQPGAVLSRVAASHLRVGTFQYAAASGEPELVRKLADYAIARHYPDAAGAPNAYLEFYRQVIDAQASLVARWMLVGFVHGVMNTDNMTISGETIDYGPCAFLDEYDPHKKFSSIDTAGRYAFANQPRIALWNLTRLAEALLPLLADNEDEAVRLAKGRLDRFPAVFEAAHLAVLRAKLGLGAREHEDDKEDDRAMAEDLLERLASNKVDYTLFFRRLCASAEDPGADAQTAALFANEGAFFDWAERWRERLSRENVEPNARAAAMRRVNPAFIPRNHRVEEIIRAAVAHGDYAPFEALLDVVTRPYDDRADRPELARFAEPPKPEERVLETFCGT